MPSLTKLPSIPEPHPELGSLTVTVNALKQFVESLIGLRGSDSVVFASDMASGDAGIGAQVGQKLNQAQVLARISIGV